MSPLEPLAVRQISPRFLPEDERVKIADLASRGLGPTTIGSELGRAASTISRELRRDLHTSATPPFHAHSEAAVRRRRERPMKIMENTALFEFVLAMAPGNPGVESASFSSVADTVAEIGAGLRPRIGDLTTRAALPPTVSQSVGSGWSWVGSSC